MHNNILRAVDNQKAVALVLLDLSSVLGTNDHNIILSQLRMRLGVGSNPILKKERSLLLMKHCHLLLMYCMVSYKARYLVQNYLKFIHCLLLTLPVNTWKIWMLIKKLQLYDGKLNFCILAHPFFVKLSLRHAH